MAMSITAAEVAQRLGGAKPAAEGWYARCPAHADKHASMWIGDRAGGGLNVKCHAGCASETVAAKLRSMSLWPEPGVRKREKGDAAKRYKRGGEVVEILSVVPAGAPEIDWRRQFRKSAPSRLYEYRNAEGQPTSLIARWDELTEKTVRPISLARLQSGELQWVMMAPEPPHALYNRDLLAGMPDAHVLIGEGEKVADYARDHFPDFVSVTWRGGAGAVHNTDFGPLAGRHVVLCPDADAPGAKAMAEVATLAIAAGAASVRIVNLPPNLPKGWDIADPAPAGLDVGGLIEAATPIDASATPEAADGAQELPGKKSDDVARQLPAARDDLLCFTIPADQLSKIEVAVREPIIEFLLTSSLTMIFAPRGLGKTFLALTLAIAVAQGVNFLCYRVNRQWRVVVEAFPELYDVLAKQGYLFREDGTI